MKLSSRICLGRRRDGDVGVSVASTPIFSRDASLDARRESLTHHQLPMLVSTHISRPAAFYATGRAEEKKFLR